MWHYKRMGALGNQFMEYVKWPIASLTYWGFEGPLRAMEDASLPLLKSLSNLISHTLHSKIIAVKKWAAMLPSFTTTCKTFRGVAAIFTIANISATLTAMYIYIDPKPKTKEDNIFWSQYVRPGYMCPIGPLHKRLPASAMRCIGQFNGLLYTVLLHPATDSKPHALTHGSAYKCSRLGASAEPWHSVPT